MITAGTVGFFSLQGIQEYSYIMIIIPFLLTVIAYLLVHTWSKQARGLVLCLYLVATVAGAFGALSPSYFQTKGSYHRSMGFFYRDPWLETALALSELPGGSVLWALGDGVASGGYYVFHHHNQLFFPSGVPSHAELINGHDVHDYIRYIVAPVQANGITRFHQIKVIGGFCIYENDIVPDKQELTGYTCGFELPIEKPVFNLLLQDGLIKSVPTMTPWR
jgi:hypothetical protein